VSVPLLLLYEAERTFFGKEKGILQSVILTIKTGKELSFYSPIKIFLQLVYNGLNNLREIYNA